VTTEPIECSCYKLPHAKDGIIRHRPGCPNRLKWADLWGIDPDYGDTTEAAEQKRLIEVATRLGYELGRKEAATDIAHRCELDVTYDAAARYHFAQIARSIASLLPGAASTPRTDPDGHSDLPEDAKAPQEPCEDPACPVPLMHSHPEGLPGDGE
jgi:hypothetical protein